MIAPTINATRPKITDADYDVIPRRMHAIQAALSAPHPAGLPHHRLELEARRKSGFAKQRHRTPMLSLDNAFDEADFAEFCARARRFLAARSRTRSYFRRQSPKSTASRST